MFRPYSGNVLPCKRHFLTMSRYVSTELELVSTVHEVCFARIRGMFQLTWSMFGRCTSNILTTAQGIFLLCSRYASTVHEVCFDRRSRYVSTVLEVCFNRAQNMFRRCTSQVSTVLCSGCVSTVLEVCFDRARGRFRPSSEYVSSVARVMFQPCSRYVFDRVRYEL